MTNTKSTNRQTLAASHIPSAGSRLDYVSTVASNHLSGQTLKEIKERVEAARTKLNDKRLHLALVGEFSSGKSTFVNALIGHRLLKEGVMPTTACATYIENAGTEMTVDVAFSKGKTFHATAADFSALALHLSSKYHHSPTTLAEAIEMLTSDQKIARHVTSLHINLPKSNIPHDIVIIDTPGFNPGADTVNNHYEVTRHVVEHVADAALVLTPQEQAMSSSLISFLHTTLRRCLHRCIYVVTKLDLLQPQYREELLTFVHHRLEQDLGLAHPMLYAESALSTLPVYEIPKGMEQEWQELQRQFRDFEQQTWQTLQRNRQTVLAEHIRSITIDIVAACEQKMKERQAALQRDRKFLDTCDVENIRTVCADMARKAVNDYYAAMKRFSYTIEFQKQKCKEAVKKEIEDSCSLSFSDGYVNLGSSAYDILGVSNTLKVQRFLGGLKRKLNSSVKNVASKEKIEREVWPAVCQLINKTAQQDVAAVGSKLRSYIVSSIEKQVEVMQGAFVSHYKGFPTLAPKERVPDTSIISVSMPQISMGNAESSLTTYEQEEAKHKKGGAAAGAAIGVILGGPAGAVLGAGAGWLTGIFSGNRTDEKREALISAANSGIDSFYTSLKLKIDNAASTAITRYGQLLTKFADDHVKQYGQAVDQLRADHDAKKAEIDRQVRSLKNVILTLGNMGDDIRVELEQLKNR